MEIPETTFIYTLSDPRNNNVRYVGKTDRINKRLWYHITPTKLNKNTHKNNWIKKLLKENIKPDIKVIDKVPYKEWKYWETYWISQMKSWGFNLTNSTSGGDGFGSGKDNPMYGKKRPDLLAMNKSDNHPAKGAKRSDEYKENLSKVQSKILFKQYTIDGEFIKQWKGFTRSGLELNICGSDIARCCYGERKSAGGFQWCLIGDEDKIIENYDPILYKLKKVIQYDLEGSFIKEWDSIIEAKERLGNHVNICAVASGKRGTAGGYQWRYKENDDFSLKIEPIKYKIISNKAKPIIQYDLNGNFIKEWPSIEKAQKELYIHSNCIRAVCYGRSKTIGGFIWKFKGDELKLKDHVNLNFKPIVQYDLKGNKIKEWNSIKEAANKFDVSHSCISTAISGYRGKKNAAGFVWKFKNKI